MAICNVSSKEELRYSREMCANIRTELDKMIDELFAQPTKMKTIHKCYSEKMEQQFENAFNKGCAYVYSALYDGDIELFQRDLSKLMLVEMDEQLTNEERVKFLNATLSVINHCLKGDYSNAHNLFEGL